jgi:hypothetical protein
MESHHSTLTPLVSSYLSHTNWPLFFSSVRFGSTLLCIGRKEGGDFSVHNALHCSTKGSVYSELLPSLTTVGPEV